MLTNDLLTPSALEFIKSTISGSDAAGIVVEIAGKAASDRSFLRIRTCNRTLILVVWDCRDPDWDRFLSIASSMEQTGLLPTIVAHDAHHGFILEEDLGDRTLKKHCLTCGSICSELKDWYEKVVKSLMLFHAQPYHQINAIFSRAMDEELFLWESGYFSTHCVTEFFGCDKLLTNNWHEDCLSLAREAASQPWICIHRDFQSENILLDENDAIRLVDFQGARKGPAAYDCASLLFDPYIPFLTMEFGQTMLGEYNRLTGKIIPERDFLICAAQRLMQALGAFGNLSIHKNKPGYKKFIPIALKRLQHVVSSLDDFKSIKRVVDGCVEKL